MSSRFAIVVAILLLSLASRTLAQVVYERPLTEAERTRFALDGLRTLPMPPGATAESLRARFAKNVAPYIFRIELVPRQGVEGGMVMEIHDLGHDKQAVVVYERPLTEDERQRYALDGGEGYSVANDATAESLREKFQKTPPGEDIFKIELTVVPTKMDQKDLRYYRLGTDKIRQSRLENLDAIAKKTYAIGKDFGNYSYQNGAMHLPFGAEIYPVGGADTSFFIESFKDNKRRSNIDHSFYEAFDRPVTLHEFARLAIQGDFKLIKTDFGFVFEVTFPPDNPFVTVRNAPQEPGKWLAWISGEHRAVYVRGMGDAAYDFLPYYGKALPSSLPADAKIDKKQWAIQEVDEALPILRAAASHPTKDATFITHRRWVTSALYAPVFVLDPKKPSKFETLAERVAFCEALNDWWTQYRGQVEWEKDVYGKGVAALVVKGQHPAEVAAREAEAAKAEQLKALARPMTPEEKEDAKKMLGDMIVRQMEKWSAQDKANAAPEDVGRVKLARTEDGGWVREIPETNGGLRTYKYLPPAITETGEDRKPLEAIVHVRKTSDPLRQGDSNVYRYRYYKLAKEWCLE